MSIINSYRYADVGGVALSYEDFANNTTDTVTFSFSSVGIGAASAGRLVVVGVVGRASGTSALTVDSVTVASTSATQVVSATSINTATSVAALYVVSVPSGTTANIDVVLSRSSLRCSIVTWEMSGASATAVGTASDTVSVNKDGSVSGVASSSGGVAVGLVGYGQDSQDGSTVWSGDLTEDVDQVFEFHGYSGASAGTDGTSVSATASPDAGAGGSVSELSLVVATFGPS